MKENLRKQKNSYKINDKKFREKAFILFIKKQKLPAHVK
jgi:hypothetical protein